MQDNMGYIDELRAKCYNQDDPSCILTFLLTKVYKQLYIDNVSTVSSFARSNEILKIKERNVKTVNSPQVKKERTFHAHLLVGSSFLVFQNFAL